MRYGGPKGAFFVLEHQPWCGDANLFRTTSFEGPCSRDESGRELHGLLRFKFIIADLSRSAQNNYGAK
jgi:hypothetical protein